MAMLSLACGEVLLWRRHAELHAALHLCPHPALHALQFAATGSTRTTKTHHEQILAVKEHQQAACIWIVQKAGQGGPASGGKGRGADCRRGTVERRCAAMQQQRRRLQIVVSTTRRALPIPTGTPPLPLYVVRHSLAITQEQFLDLFLSHFQRGADFGHDPV